MNNLHVVLVSPVFPYPRRGVYVGIERYVLELARRLKDAGCSIDVLTTYWNGGTNRDLFEGMRITRVSDLSQLLGRYASLFDLHYLSWGKVVAREFERLGICDVVHALGPLSSAKFIEALGVPLVSHFHHYENILHPRELLHKPFHHVLERSAYQHSTLVLTASEHSARVLRSRFRVPEKRIRQVPHGVDTHEFSPRAVHPLGAPVILCVGSHELRKGMSYLLEALGLLEARNVKFNVLSVGLGPETETLKSVAGRLGIASRVRFLGLVDQLPDVYRSADLFVHPALEEGFGMVMIEAMASGLPIVASEAGAIPEVVGDSGLLVTPRNPLALANAMERILTDASLAATLAQRGLERVKRLYSWDRVIEQTLRVYGEAIRIVHR